MTRGEWRETLEPLRLELARIATALERFEPVTEPDTGAPVCPHPEDARLALGAGDHGWVCQLCQHVEERTTP